MPLQVLIAAMPKELEGLVEATRRRPDLVAVPCPSGVKALEAIAQSPAVALVRLRLPDVDGTNICRRLRAAASESTRIFMLLDDGETKYRDVCFKSGCDDVVFAPLDPDDLAQRLAAADEMKFLRTPRIAFRRSAKLGIGGGERDVETEGISPLSLRVKWNDAPPEREIVPVTIELAPGVSRRWWARLEGRATRKGEAQGLILRWVALTRAERDELAAFCDQLRGARESTGPLESAPEGPARYEGPATAPLPAAEPSTMSEFEALQPPRARGRRRAVLYAATLALSVAGIAFAGERWFAITHPEHAALAAPVDRVEGLPLAWAGKTGTRYTAIGDPAWFKLDDDGRKRVAVALAQRGRTSGAKSFDLYVGRTHVATADLTQASPAPKILEP